MEVIINEDKESANLLVTSIIIEQINKKPDSVLGLATGSTPLLTYKYLIEAYQKQKVDFSKVKTFNLDEYLNLSEKDPQSYAYYMKDNFFSHININPLNTNIPNSLTTDVEKECQDYEEKIKEAGGIDLQLLGIGSSGHIGFNEVSSSLASRTRLKTLTEQTVKDNSSYFEYPTKVPHHVITMGVGTIMESRRCIMLAFGENKSQAVQLMVEGSVSASCPASALQFHPNTSIILDEAAASKLSYREYYDYVYQNKPDIVNPTSIFRKKSIKQDFF